MSGSEVLAFGELLWDVKSDCALLGGAPANFAFRLNDLGAAARLVSAVGIEAGSGKLDNRAADALALLSQAGMATDLIQTVPAPTGWVDVITAGTKVDYTIHRHVAYDFIESCDELLAAARGASALYFGTLSQRAVQSRHTLAEIVNELPADALRVCDINLRKECFSPETLSWSLTHATLLKVNDEEIPLVLSVLQEARTSQEVTPDDFAEAVMKRYPNLETCLVTLGEHGAFGYTDGEMQYVRGIPITLADPIGAGDSFLAGFVFKQLQGANLLASLQYANCTGALVASTVGGMSAVGARAVENMMAREYSVLGSSRDANETRARLSSIQR